MADTQVMLNMEITSTKFKHSSGYYRCGDADQLNKIYVKKVIALSICFPSKQVFGVFLTWVSITFSFGHKLVIGNVLLEARLHWVIHGDSCSFC